MPSLQELERFQTSFQNVGNERDVREKRGEPMPSSPLPGEGLDEDLAALIGNAPDLDDLDDGTGSNSQTDSESYGSTLDDSNSEASPFDSAFLDTSDYSAPPSPDSPSSPIQDTESDTQTAEFDPDSLDFGAFLDSIPDDLSLDSNPPPPPGPPPPGIPDVEDDVTLPPDQEASTPAGLVDSSDLSELEELEDLETDDGEGDMAALSAMGEGPALVDEDGASRPESPSLTGPNAPDDGFDMGGDDFSLPAEDVFTGESGDFSLPAEEEPLPGETSPTASGDFSLPAGEEFNLDDSLDLFSEEPAPGTPKTAAREEAGIPEGELPPLPSDDFAVPGDEESRPLPDSDEVAAIDGTEPDSGDFSLPEDLDSAFDLSPAETPPGDEERIPPPLDEGGFNDLDESPFSIPDLDVPAGGIELEGEDNESGELPASGENNSAPEGLPGAMDGEDPFALPVDEDAEVPLDSFDTFSLDNDIASGFGLKNDDETGGEGFADLEDFSLDGIDALFAKDGAPGKAPPPQRPARPAKSAKSSVGEEEISLTEDDFEKLEHTLDSYPLNLRMACEEIIAEQIIPADQMANLVQLLVSGASPSECASVAGKILSRNIVIPKGFEKKSGEELEAEQATFIWLFRNRILPVLKIGAFITACTALLVFMGYQFVWKPIAANSLYKKGWELIPQGSYTRSRERFDAASKIQRQKKWHYRYAEAYIDKRQYEMARQIYDETLTFYRRDKKASLDYARMESELLRNYERADRILRAQILDWRVHDREGLLAQGDNFLAWGEIDRSKYERARESFATLIEEYGPKDPFMERMLRYFIRTDSLADTLALQEHFMGSKRRKIGHETLTELGAYLIDKKEEEPEGVPDPNLERITSIGKIFERAIEQDPGYPESWYHLYRYQLRYGAKGQGLATIRQAVELFDRAEEKNATRKYQHIDAVRRYAAHLAEERSFLPAAEQLVKGAELYDDALERRILAPTPDLARIRADLGDLDYFVFARHDDALANYKRAVRDGWAPPEIRYRMGYIHYSHADWRTALEQFYDASMDLPLNRKLLFAMANTAANQGNQHMAQGYYNQLLDILELERSRFPRLVPAGSVEHAELAERIMRARNNLGVTMEELARQNGRTDYRSRALSLLSESARAWDALTRDPQSMIRAEGTNLGYLNTKMILQPNLGFAPQIYQEIDKDVLEPSAWEELLSGSSNN